MGGCGRYGGKRAGHGAVTGVVVLAAGGVKPALPKEQNSGKLNHLKMQFIEALIRCALFAFQLF